MGSGLWVLTPDVSDLNTPCWNWCSGCWRQYHYVAGPLHWGSDGCHWDSSGRVQWLTRRSGRRLELEFSFLLAAEIIQVLSTIVCCVSGNVLFCMSWNMWNVFKYKGKMYRQQQMDVFCHSQKHMGGRRSKYVRGLRSVLKVWHVWLLKWWSSSKPVFSWETTWPHWPARGHIHSR